MFELMFERERERERERENERWTGLASCKVEEREIREHGWTYEEKRAMNQKS